MIKITWFEPTNQNVIGKRETEEKAMETKKVAKEYLQKDILRTIFQMRKRQEDDKQIKRIIVLDYDLTEYHWKTNIKKLQEEGFLETDSDAKIPALTESGTEYARQLQRAAEGWNQFLQMSGVDEKTADRDGRHIPEDLLLIRLWLLSHQYFCFQSFFPCYLSYLSFLIFIRYTISGIFCKSLPSSKYIVFFLEPFFFSATNPRLQVKCISPNHCCSYSM